MANNSRIVKRLADFNNRGNDELTINDTQVENKIFKPSAKQSRFDVREHHICEADEQIVLRRRPIRNPQQQATNKN